MQTVLAWLLATFVLIPFQTELTRRLQAFDAAHAYKLTAQACIATASGALVRRAGDHWLWSTATVIDVAIGWRHPTDVVVEMAPRCRWIVEAARRPAPSTAL